jgi:peptidyl-prolyl cis-trans isomerase B (cyclophilin B)
VPPIVEATIVTNDGAIGLHLDNLKSPCTVNNFTSLARQRYFDGTPCHRLTTSDSLGVLQCGDPTGDGSGGPGYRFPNEYPTNQYRLTDPKMDQPVVYPRGTLAMANSGQGTNGSQFFLVYRDSMLPPTYTVFGTVDAAGLVVVDKIAAGGVQGGADDGKPTTTVNIASVTVK